MQDVERASNPNNATKNEAPQESATSNRSGSSPTSRTKRSWWIGGMAALVLVVIVIMAVILTSSSSDKSKSSDSENEASGDSDAKGKDTEDLTSATSFTGVKKLNYTITVHASSADGSCETGGVQSWVHLTAVCPIGALTLSDGCRILRDGRTVSCTDVPGYAEIACYAQDSTTTDLKLSVTVDSTPSNNLYKCTAKTGFMSGFNGHTWTQTYYGGTMTHKVSLQSSACSDSLMAQRDIQGSCETSEYYGGGGWDPVGSTSCYAEIPEIQVITRGEVEQDCLESFVLDAQAGEVCDHNVWCESDACIDGVCAASRLQDNELGCDDDQDCFSHGCARLDMESTESGCCASGSSIADGTGPWVCTGQPVNATCFDDDLCESGVCLFGTCADRRLEEFYWCERDNHCVTNACAYTVFDNKVCCPTSGTVDVDGTTYCANLEEDYLCANQEMCKNGACGLEEHSLEAERICCFSGSTVLDNKPGSPYTDRYCTEMEPGTVCGDDSMCAVGNSGESACARETYATNALFVCCLTGLKSRQYEVDNYPFRSDYCSGLEAGAICGGNAMCASGVCVDGYCQENIVEDWDHCDDGDDCTSQGCGVGEYSAGAELVCCPSGDMVLLNKPGDAYTAQYCTNLPIGTLCGSDDMCTAGESGAAACAREAYEAGAEAVCCTSGVKVSAYEADRYPWRKDYCANMSAGSLCGSDEMCESGVCTEDGVCQ